MGTSVVVVFEFKGGSPHNRERVQSTSDAHVPAQRRPGVEDARCVRRHAQPDLWFPERGQSTFPARRVCATCEVKRCLDVAAVGEERHGIWTVSPRTNDGSSALQLLRETVS